MRKSFSLAFLFLSLVLSRFQTEPKGLRCWFFILLMVGLVLGLGVLYLLLPFSFPLISDPCMLLTCRVCLVALLFILSHLLVMENQKKKERKLPAENPRIVLTKTQGSAIPLKPTRVCL